MTWVLAGNDAFVCHVWHDSFISFTPSSPLNNGGLQGPTTYSLCDVTYPYSWCDMTHSCSMCDIPHSLLHITLVLNNFVLQGPMTYFLCDATHSYSWCDTTPSFAMCNMPDWFLHINFASNGGICKVPWFIPCVTNFASNGGSLQDIMTHSLCNTTRSWCGMTHSHLMCDMPHSLPHTNWASNGGSL